MSINNTFLFSSTEDEALIDLVENNNVIFDSSHKKHKDNCFKENISEEVERSSMNIKYNYQVFIIYRLIPTTNIIVVNNMSTCKFLKKISSYSSKTNY